MKKKGIIITGFFVALSTGFALYCPNLSENEIYVSSKTAFVGESITAFSIDTALYFINLPDYEVVSSYSISSSGKHRETDIDVVVYKQQYNEELYRRIEVEHNRLNGEPETLTINLYHSDTERMNGIKPYTVIYIDYTNDIRKITNYPF